MFSKINIDGRFSDKKDPPSQYEFLHPIISRVPKLKEAVAVIDDVWDFIETYRDMLADPESMGVISPDGKTSRFDNNYEDQKKWADSYSIIPIQIIDGKSKDSLIIPAFPRVRDTVDFMTLTGSVGAEDPQNKYSAYFILDYSVGRN
ncbi:hypothetical protein RBH29_16205 [Herbivorax sp. ANBcel31]|uniref:hypothetical protein n=1 Tax=Herbivorax sp. ANBcel31 TaxID=3069754 RepID=UPI0027B4EE3D|nr:hypothetical protein [Herbivorax sp. ANBcel31]MDQ2087973.1 hypothetical protein [Herbivorax sp. ANBcel31]